ncbi:hypothetical protein O1M54_02470 [Streptomyces diastatochromogenes]|nr:hypothetical protein [Streptomyces diastatochromogenes]
MASTLEFSAGFTADGTVRLRGARVSDNLTFEGAVLNGPPDGHGPSLVALLMRAVDFDFTPARPPSGTVDLRGAQVSYLHDSDHSWPDTVELDGFVYGSIKVAEAGERREAVARRDSVAHRVAWIRRSPGYNPQPYEQLASWYRKAGHDDDARRVLLARQRHRRRTLHPAGRLWGLLLDAAVGYGYRPGSPRCGSWRSPRSARPSSAPTPAPGPVRPWAALLRPRLHPGPAHPDRRPGPAHRLVLDRCRRPAIRLPPDRGRLAADHRRRRGRDPDPQQELTGPPGRCRASRGA